MPPDQANLFTAAGLVLTEEPTRASKRQRKPLPPSPAERAASGRLEGARRSRMPVSQGQRTRVGPPRNLALAEVLAFPLTRNVVAVAEMIEALPHGYAPNLNKRRDQEARNLQNRLVGQGIPKQSAWLCARELVHIAYMKRVEDAHKEAGIL